MLSRWQELMDAVAAGSISVGNLLLRLPEVQQTHLKSSLGWSDETVLATTAAQIQTRDAGAEIYILSCVSSVRLIDNITLTDLNTTLTFSALSAREVRLDVEARTNSALAVASHEGLQWQSPYVRLSVTPDGQGKVILVTTLSPMPGYGAFKAAAVMALLPANALPTPPAAVMARAQTELEEVRLDSVNLELGLSAGRLQNATARAAGVVGKVGMTATLTMNPQGATLDFKLKGLATGLHKLAWLLGLNPQLFPDVRWNLLNGMVKSSATGVEALTEGLLEFPDGLATVSATSNLGETSSLTLDYAADAIQPPSLEGALQILLLPGVQLSRSWSARTSLQRLKITAFPKLMKVDAEVGAQSVLPGALLKLSGTLTVEKGALTRDSALNVAVKNQGGLSFQSPANGLGFPGTLPPVSGDDARLDVGADALSITLRPVAGALS